MELIVLLQMIRAEHIARYEALYEEQKLKHEELFAELSFELGNGTFQNLYTVDLVSRNGGETGVIELGAERDFYTGRLSQSVGSLNVKISSVTWDDMAFTLEPFPNSLIGFELWFQKWLDLDATRESKHPVFGEVIHSATWQENVVSIDFGSSPIASFMELMSVFEASGVKSVEIKGTRF